MKNLTTKLLVALTCVAFASVQYANADAYINAGDTTGKVLSGADIVGHTGGLTNIDRSVPNQASLQFNKDTRVDWGHLNVAKDEALHFVNGNNNILNVVQNGASRFAGQVTGQTGKVIISNPNGIIFTGGNAAGTFAGGLVLTTKNLAGVEADAIKNLNLEQIKEAANGTNFGVIALKDGASITAGQDITIISNGFSMDGAKLLSENGSVLITSDGANFVAADLSDDQKVTLKDVIDDNGNTSTETAQLGRNRYNYGADENNANYVRVYTPVYVCSSKINADNGKIAIDIHNNSGSMANSLMVKTSELSAKDVNLSSGNSVILNSENNNPKMTVNGNLDIKADRLANVKNIEVNGNTNVEATTVDIGNSTPNGAVFNGDLTVTDPIADYNWNTNNLTGIGIYNSKISGKLAVNPDADVLSNIRGADPVNIGNVTAGSADLKGQRVYMQAITFGDTNIDTYGAVRIEGNSEVGNLKITTNKTETNNGSVLFGSYTATGDKRGEVLPNNTLKVNGDLNIDAGSTIAIAADVKVTGKANLSTARSSVIVADTDKADCKIDADGGIEINAPASVNKLVPLSGEIIGEGIEYGSKETDNNGQEYRVSSFYKETNEDYVIKDRPENPDNPDNPDVPGDEPEKNITNLVIDGVDTSSAQAFTPIAFAADDESDNVKRIAKIVFKTPDGIVSISDRLIQKDINSSF